MLPVKSKDFDRFLRGRLCWVDGHATHASSARQRQCPHCRRKWSYDRLQMHWNGAMVFATGKTRQDAARKLGVDIHTAARLYAAMEEKLAAHFVLRLKTHEGLPMVDDAELLHVRREMRRLRTRAGRNRHLVELGLRHLGADRRLDLIYRLCFQKEATRAAGVR